MINNAPGSCASRNEVANSNNATHAKNCDFLPMESSLFSTASTPMFNVDNATIPSTHDGELDQLL